ncbi:LysR family transcriptional regulator [Sphingomonas baiyangensis]|uniref:LysR family transcriptional regulator n=1 Tax=Sphingomonas baiyangensis TaxID=2572576 RepID=A0A4U1L245_9SPHN|nr:LysR family transcriptional regulator [Sphingomonas baiyangensis]TKD50672.1 LysR family transcriptional regulator [Sphingomonas baiyangensis]
MAIEIRQLRAFLAIAETGSIGRAAERVHLTQPAISRTLAEMERRLGHRLFERHARGMAPTAAGETLLPYARLMIFEAEQARRALDALDGLERGVVRVGAVGTIVRGLLPGVVRTLLANAPGLSCSIIEAPDEQLQAQLCAREIDLVIGSAAVDDGELATIGECRHDDRFTVFAAADHPLSDTSLAAVLACDWVMPLEAMAPRRMFLETVAATGAGVTPRIALETTSHDAMLRFVAETRLLGWLPQSLIADALAAGQVRVIAVPELHVSRRFFLLQRARGSLPPAARAFIDLLPLISGETE